MIISGVSVRAKDVMKLLRISRPTLHRYVKQGRIKYEVLPNGFYEYNDEDVYAIFNKGEPRATHIYARVPTMETNVALDTQISQVKAWAITNDAKIDGVFAEIASGITFEGREKFMKLLKEIMDGQVGEVLVTDIDRLSMTDKQLVRHLFAKFGTKIVATVNRMSSETDTDELVSEIERFLIDRGLDKLVLDGFRAAASEPRMEERQIAHAMDIDESRIAATLGFLKGRGVLGLPEVAAQLELSNEDTVSILTQLVLNGYLDYSTEGEEIVVEGVRPPFAVPQTCTKHWMTVGYCVLRGVVSISEIATQLELEKHQVERSVFESIAAGQIVAGLGRPSSKRGQKGDGLFIQLQEHETLDVLGLKPHVRTESSAKKEKGQETLMKGSKGKSTNEGAYTQWKPSHLREDLHISPRLHRCVTSLAGILLLRRKSKLSQLASDLFSGVSKEELRRPPKADVLRQLSLLALDPLFRTRITEQGWVIVDPAEDIWTCLSQRSPYESEIMSTRALLGFLGSTNATTLRQIGKEMSASGKKLSERDVLLTLASLVMTGALRARLSADGSLSGIEVSASAVRSTPALSKDETVFVGMLLCQESVSLKQASVVLGTDTAAIRQIFHGIVGQGSIVAEISKGGAVIVRSFPAIPPLAQVTHLPIVKRELLGLIHAFGGIEQSELAAIFDLDSRDIELSSYELAGLGLLECRIRDGHISGEMDTPSGILPSPLETIGNKALRDVADVIGTVGSATIQIYDIGELTKLNINSVLRALGRLVADGYYPEGTIEDGAFNCGGVLRQDRLTVVCQVCGTEHDKALQFCPDCKSEQIICSVCKGEIKEQTRAVYCPICRSASHASHIRAWLALRQSCPICRSQIDFSQLLHSTALHEGDGDVKKRRGGTT